MKTIICAMSLAAGLLSAGTALADQKAAKAAVAPEKEAAVSFKVGVLDWQLLAAKSPQADSAGKRLEKEFKSRKDAFVEKQKQLETKHEKLQRDKEVMSEAERTKSERELMKLQQDLRTIQEENQSDYATRHREEMDKFLNVVKEVVDKYAVQEKFDLILPQDATLYVSDRMDITPVILEKLKHEKKGL